MRRNSFCSLGIGETRIPRPGVAPEGRRTGEQRALVTKGKRTGRVNQSLTYGGACPLEDVAVQAASLQEVLVTRARDPDQRAGAVQRAHVDVQRPHVVAYHIAVHWEVHEN